MVGDIMIRLFNQQPEVQNTEDLGGLVIIDELDLHLHPKWLRQLPTLLSEVLPNVQFIVSTHSEIPFLGAPKNSVFLKVNRNKDEGIQIERLEVEVKNLLPNSLLTSSIFDLQDIFNKYKDINEVRTEDFYKDIIESGKLKEKLKVFEESDMDFPDHLFETDKEETNDTGKKKPPKSTGNSHQ
jgi:predicted ATP-binding protein involved in virulence